MDIQYFLNILGRRKWLILAVALLAASTTFVYLHFAKEKFRAHAVISTGIMDLTGLSFDKDNPFIQKYTVDMGFSKIMEFIRSQRNVTLLSYHLLLHDLEHAEDGKSFRTPKWTDDNPAIDFNSKEVKSLKTLLRDRIETLEYSLDSPELEPVYKKLCSAYAYDDETINEKNMDITRKGDSDLLEISFTCEHPGLAAYAINQFVKTFLSNYQNIRSYDESADVAFYKRMVAIKKEEYDSLRTIINIYKQNNNVIDLGNQKEATITFIADLEKKKQEALAIVEGSKDKKTTITKAKGKTQEDLVANNTNIILANKAIANLNERLNLVREKMIQSSSKESKLQKEYDLLTKARDEALRKAARNIDPESQGVTNKENLEVDLFTRELTSDLDYMEAKATLDAVNRELGIQRARANSFVSDEAFLSNLDQEFERVRLEYNELNDALNKARIKLENKQAPVKILTNAQLPDKAEPKNRIILSAFAGFVAAVFAIVVVFLLTFLDPSLHSPDMFRSRLPQIPLLAAMPKINTKNWNLASVFSGNSKEDNAFKEGVRTMRTRLEENRSSTLLLTSTKSGEGKTTLTKALATSMLLKQYRVLIIDTNFKNNELSKDSELKQVINGEVMQNLLNKYGFARDFEAKSLPLGQFHADVLTNKGVALSPGEVFGGRDFNGLLNDLSLVYDFILMEGANMNEYADTRELVQYAGKIICTFDAASSLSSQDKQSLEYLEETGKKFLGAVLNKTDIRNIKY